MPETEEAEPEPAVESEPKIDAEPEPEAAESEDMFAATESAPRRAKPKAGDSSEEDGPADALNIFRRTAGEAGDLEDETPEDAPLPADSADPPPAEPGALALLASLPRPIPPELAKRLKPILKRIEASGGD